MLNFMIFFIIYSAACLSFGPSFIGLSVSNFVELIVSAH